jgi:formate hydrogenlyase subunit 6/NADH:ubiquinone oxidoreductase subunit I
MDKKGVNRRVFLKNGLKGGIAISSAGLFLYGCSSKSLDLKKEIQSLDIQPDRKVHYKTYMDAYKFDDCIECGECLYGCPFKDLSQEQAIENIIKMREGDKETCDKMLDQCCFCFKCNHRCPQDAVPTALMLQRLKERREEEGSVPAPLKYSMNGMKTKGWEHNIFRDMYTDHNEEERAIIKKWSEPKDCGDGDLLFCGCGVRLFPSDIEESEVLAGLPKFGGENDCCGLYPSRGGLNEVGRFVSNNLIDRLAESKFDRLVVMCGSCLEMFKVSMPHYIGQEFPFKAISVYEYVAEQMEKGLITIKRKVPVEERDACISDSCHGYEFGEDFTDLVRKLGRDIGYSFTELRHNRENNACCGLAGYLRDGNLWSLIDAKNVKKKDIEDSGKENILTYCQGCYLNSHLMMPGNSHYLLEKLLWALGDDINFQSDMITSRALNLSTMISMIKIGPSALF